MLSLLLNGHTVGSATLENGVLQAECAYDTRYIYRLELVGDTRLMLGVMLPKNNSFVLFKQNIPAGKWQYCEILRSLPGEPVCPPLPFALSHGEDIGDCSFCSDALLKDCLKLVKDGKTAVYSGKRYVYFPFVLSCENPMAPFFFCLTCFCISGAYYAALKICDGIPCPI